MEKFSVTDRVSVKLINKDGTSKTINEQQEKPVVRGKNAVGGQIHDQNIKSPR